MAQPPLLTLQNIHLTFGGTPLLEGAEMQVHPRDRVCLVGRNGSGKSTFLKIAAGTLEPDEGTRFLQPGATWRTLEQEPDFSAYKTVEAFVEAGLAPGDDPHKATTLLETLGISPSADPQHLSGGEARRAALARVLAPEPDILFLDEPTNHLDLPTIQWLEAVLGRLSSALVLISHDRRFLENLSNRTVWLDRGLTRSLDRGFAHFEAWRDRVFEEEEMERHKLDRKIVREEHWLTYGVTARRKRNERRLAALHSLRQQRREAKRAPGQVALAVAEGKTSGKLVIEADSVSKSYDGRFLVRDLTLKVQRGDRIGIAGPNGAGKTTLINLLTGSLVPDQGTIRLGTNLQKVTLDQKRESLNPGETLVEALTGGRGDMVSVGGEDGHQRHVMSYMKDFLFTGEQARSPISALSGGERGRLALALALAQPSNLLVLDEPTNDLDLETLDLLQELLTDYQGTVLLVSHDRDFLDRLVTSLLTLEEADGPGAWREFAGGYTDMLAQKQGRDTGPEKPLAAEKQKKAKAPGDSSPKGKAATPQKLSFKEKHALETLPQRIEELESTMEKLKALLAEPDLFTRDPDRFKKAAAALERAENERDLAEETWLTLEMRREELEQAQADDG